MSETIADLTAQIAAGRDGRGGEEGVSSAGTSDLGAGTESTPRTAEANNAALTGKVEVAVPVPPPTPAAPRSLADFLKNAVPAPVSIVPGQSPLVAGYAPQAQLQPSEGSVTSAIAASGSLPPGLTLFSPSELTSGYLHAMLYGETDARKSTSAATFGTPENTRIVLVRRPEQLIPLRDLGFGANTVAHCEDADAARYALLNADSIWPDWAKLKDRVLVIDDFTRVKDLLLGDNEMAEQKDARGNVVGYKEVRDARQVHKAAKDDMYEIMQTIFKKPQHVIGTALAQVYTNNVSHEETLSPDIPPSMARMLTTEFEFVFFIDKRTWRFVTTQKLEVYEAKDEKGHKQSHTRSIFAKRKLPMACEAKNLIWQDEDMDLRKLWDRVKTGVR